MQGIGVAENPPSYAWHITDLSNLTAADAAPKIVTSMLYLVESLVANV
jgi:hypothetical protein